MQAPKFSLRKIFYNNKSLVLISILAAVLFWFVVVSNITPQINKTFGGVKVQLSDQTPNLESLGLQVITTDQQTVSVEVNGPRYLVGKLSANDLIVTGQVDRISKPGTFSVQLSAALAESDSQLTVKKITPSHISVYFDRRVAKQMPITVETTGGKPADGYMLGSPTANPAAVTVIGPEQELLHLTKAVATLKVDNNVSADFSGTSDIVLYTKSGLANMDNITLGALKTSVAVPVLKTKTLKLTLGVTNPPSGFDLSNVSYTLTPSTVLVAGKDDVIDALGPTLQVGSVAVPNLDLKTTRPFALTLPDGVSSVPNIRTVSAAITLQNTAKKMFSTGNFTTANLPGNFGVNILSDSVNNIEVFGPASQVAGVRELLATVNLAGVNETGPQNVPVIVTVPGKNGFWVRGVYQARVYIWRR